MLEGVYVQSVLLQHRCETKTSHKRKATVRDRSEHLLHYSKHDQPLNKFETTQRSTAKTHRLLLLSPAHHMTIAHIFTENLQKLMFKAVDRSTQSQRTIHASRA